MTVAPDDPNMAQAWISGTAPDQTVDFYIPRGNMGPRGPRGLMGPSPVVGTVETNMGPAAPGTIGDPGPTGAKGDPGGFVTGTLLDASNLNTILTPGLYRQITGANTTLANNYPINNNGGILIVTEMSTGYVVQTYESLNGLSTSGSTMWKRQYANSVWTPWKAFNSVRVDQTAGRAIYQWDDLNGRDQLVYGDTGWRQVVAPADIATLPNMRGFIRRIGNRVSFIAYEITAGGTTSTATALYVVPSGFRFVLGPAGSPAMISGDVIDSGAAQITGASIYISSAGTYSVMLKPVLGVRHYTRIEWITNDVWPSILPGIAEGTIPNV